MNENLPNQPKNGESLKNGEGISALENAYKDAMAEDSAAQGPEFFLDLISQEVTAEKKEEIRQLKNKTDEELVKLLMDRERWNPDNIMVTFFASQEAFVRFNKDT